MYKLVHFVYSGHLHNNNASKSNLRILLKLCEQVSVHDVVSKIAAEHRSVSLYIEFVTNREILASLQKQKETNGCDCFLAWEANK